MSTLFEQLAFFLAIILLFLLPGFFILTAFFRNKLPKISGFECLIYSFAIGLSTLDFGMLLLSKMRIPLTAISISVFTSILVAISIGFLMRNNSAGQKEKRGLVEKIRSTPFLDTLGFSKKEGFLFVGLIVLTLLIKSVFLWGSILPTSTDLGHHMYWAKKITIDGAVPTYEKINIAYKNGENTLTPPEPIDDFIIGEHLPFAALSLVTKTDVLSAFPSLFLFLINIFSILTLAFLSYRLFEDILGTPALARIGLLATLLIAGPVWALSSPEAKYVSGGVVGNVLGNFLIPLIILTFFRALREKSTAFLGLALLFLGTLAFTHHLSTLIFLYVSIFIFIAFLLFNGRKALSDVRLWLRMFLSPFPFSVLFFLITMTVFVYTPTYLDLSAIDTALGSPTKTTREGLDFSELVSGVGGSRFGLELIGIVLLLISKSKETLARSVAIGWSVGLIIMSLFPGAVLLDIPSNRIGTYGTLPTALLAACAIPALFMRQRSIVGVSTRNDHLLQWSFSLILTAVIIGGFFDNAGALPKKDNSREAVQTFVASSWLSRNTAPDEWVLKDHNYIVADSWMKLFFMRDYSYPLSRGFFRRYNDEVTTREQCTLLMISAPNTPKGKECFSSTGTSTVVINPKLDGAQFNKAKNMSLLYLSDDIAIYKKAKK